MTVYCKLSRRAILVATSTKHTIGRHLGGSSIEDIRAVRGRKGVTRDFTELYIELIELVELIELIELAELTELRIELRARPAKFSL
jgi:hypothetical protein